MLLFKIAEMKKKKYHPKTHIEEKLYEDVLSTVLRYGKEVADLLEFEHPADEKFGDFSTNIAMKLAGKLERNPLEIAEEITEDLKTKTNAEITVQKPGFINFMINTETLKKEIPDILKKEDNYGNSNFGKGKKFMIEFGQPNTHKIPHIGHLFSYILGESLARIIETQGYKIFRANYQGDIGLHVAKCLWSLTRKELPKFENLEERINFLQTCYQEGSAAYLNNETAKKEIDELNAKVYHKDPAIVKIWKETRNWSLENYKNFENRLGIKYNKSYCESKTAEEGVKIINENLNKVFKKDKGAVIFEGKRFKLHNRVFLNQMKLPTYEAKDLALAEMKYKDWPFDYSLVTTASEQNEYFKVVIKTLEQISPNIAKKYHHLGFGMINLKTGKMASRTGQIITAIELVETAKSKIKEFLKQNRDYSEKEVEKISEITGIGAVKYSFLKTQPTKNITFDLETSISFEGQSGPYIQYTYARAKSILREAKVEISSLIQKVQELTFTEKEETDILRSLYTFPEILQLAAENYAPNYVAEYIFDLAQKFNAFYRKHSVLKAENDVKISRLALAAATAQILKNGLNVLGIEVLERM